jgi:hypothetical protein
MSKRAVKKKLCPTLASLPPRIPLALVGAFLNCSDDHVASLIRSGALQAVDLKTGPRAYYRVLKESLVAFIESRKAK